MLIKANDDWENLINDLCLPSIALLLLKTSGEREYFYRNYYGTNMHAIEDLMDYREYRISSSSITLEEFLKLCNNKGISIAFEATFLLQFEVTDISLIKQSLNNGKITLECIFENFKKNKNFSILKYIL
ncbi:hypothetical protein [Thermoactinomyces sp. DSM 45892]|uniref:hypothetical protein n=1 Tax=Thermoactinomyces sp. DSM 45892 TaxID=1882753 RepID=UPI00089AE589|nr:hypothetical protein [Thermoactinomyces sp. DSM 45892]SDX94062.1 hypothetical protein SAMN05444416_10161 [Thermoactinomyces sp. DSM 45892]